MSHTVQWAQGRAGTPFIHDTQALQAFLMQVNSHQQHIFWEFYMLCVLFCPARVRRHDARDLLLSG